MLWRMAADAVACTVWLALLASCTIPVSNRLVYLTSIGLSRAMAGPLPIHRADTVLSFPLGPRTADALAQLAFYLPCIIMLERSAGHMLTLFDSRVFLAGRRVDIQYLWLLLRFCWLEIRWVLWMVGGDSVG